MVEKSPTVVLRAWFWPALMLSRSVQEFTRFAPLVDTDSGNDHGGRIDVADGIGHCVGETISS